MMPGKPVMAGNIDGKPVVGLPGYPVASQTALRELVVPFLVRWGLARQDAVVVPARLARNIPSELGFDEFIPVSIGSVAGCTWVYPHPRGSGLQMNLVRANGYLHVPAFSEGQNAGTVAHVHLTTATHLVDRVLLCTGPREPGVAILADTLAGRDVSMHIFPARPIELIPALRMNSCHIGILCIPGTDGVSGIPEIPGDMQLIGLHIGESQVGLVSRDTISADDLGRIRVVNAPRESGRRTVLDWLLAELDLTPDRVAGYQNEAKNDLVVAEAIRNNRADAGIGSSSLAASAGLRFLPLVTESLELLIRKDALGDYRIQTMKDVVKSAEFQDLLQRQAGYITKKTGQLRDLSPGFDKVCGSRGEGIRQP
jgi:putative molybdopterin biosynthesis protein